MRQAAMQQRVGERASEGRQVDQIVARIADRNERPGQNHLEVHRRRQEPHAHEMDADAQGDEDDHHARNVEGGFAPRRRRRRTAARLGFGIVQGIC
jgi:ABC-type Zn2+ transport system substrate-binding protein/surface adhesin